MANHKSALKRIRQNQKRAQRNSSNRTLMKTASKKVLAEIEANNVEGAQTQFRLAQKEINKVRSKGVIHKNAAARKIASLAKKVDQLSKAG